MKMKSRKKWDESEWWVIETGTYGRGRSGRQAGGKGVGMPREITRPKRLISTSRFPSFPLSHTRSSSLARVCTCWSSNARSRPIFWFQKLGREVSRVLLFSYPLELALAFTYSIFGCIDLVSVYLSPARREMLMSRMHALGGREARWYNTFRISENGICRNTPFTFLFFLYL